MSANSPPSISCGQFYSICGTTCLFVKTDIVCTDSDAGDVLTFFIVNIVPPFANYWEVDANTGAFSIQTANLTDNGIHDICIGVSDGTDTADCCFQIDVIPCDCSGDVNCDANVNISDVVYLINYIFKGGYRPPILNWADVNGDCAINVADAVYMIKYIFHSGPELQLGCVE
jgi:hypothetical protein